nr:DNA ligase 3 [Ciona intestinalis]|eukprot:XP_002129234.1 DNA ligase 3 [Ciona intestinalis]
MSDSTRFTCDYGKRKSNCKKCKKPIEKGSPRIAKCVPNYFNDGDGEMKQYHHIPCMFETFVKARATTKKIEDVSDLDGFADMKDEEKDEIKKLVATLCANQAAKKTPKKATPKKRKSSDPVPSPAAKVSTPQKKIKTDNSPSTSCAPAPRVGGNSKDNQFREFRRLCGMIAEEASYNEKTNIAKRFFEKGSSGDGFTGDLFTIVKLLMPGAVKRTYNLQSKQLVKLFSRIFVEDVDDMMEDLEQGDVSETVYKFFESNTSCPPTKKSTLTIHDVDDFLENLSKLTREEDQLELLKKLAKRSTGNDLRTVIRLIKCDLKITAGPKHILDALDSNAHEAFKASRDLKDVLDRIEENKKSGSKKLEVRASLMTPVSPMLAEACKSVEQAMKKCPNGMYSEIKYDGERVQLHMKGKDFQFYSRSLKPVSDHKIMHFEKYIPDAFPDGHSMILDSEVLLVDVKTGNPLPFGTLGIHKKSKFQDANVCLFIFDILQFNGENLMGKSMKERRTILETSMKVIPNRVMLSELKFVNKPDDLKHMIVRVIKEGLEGLVLKDIKGVYEPGKRHWLKVKKDYLMQGQMADTADLVVLGAYYGTGSKGGMMSVFLMGVYDEKRERWCTVTKVGNGHDDETLEKINKQLKVEKISKDMKRVPKWLNLNKNHVPDLVVADPKNAPVWEITGTEFTQSESHTAEGISIRFPRVTKIRRDKNWKTATSLERLKALYLKSKEESDISHLLGVSSTPVVKDEKSTSKSTQKVSVFQQVKENNEEKLLKMAESEFLNDIFLGVKIFIPTDVEKRKKMERHILAFNGDVLGNDQFKEATHIVQCDSVKVADIPISASLVTASHVWECIKNKVSL